MPVDNLDRVGRAQVKLKELSTRYNFAEFRARVGEFGVCQVQFRLHGQSWPHNWLEEDVVNESRPDLLRLFKDEICPRRVWSSLPPNAVVDETGEFRGLWSKVQKKRPLGVSTAPESGIKREDGIQDIKPALTPPSSPPPGLSLAMEDDMYSAGGTTGQPAPHEPTPAPRRILYDPTLYPPTKPVVPKQGRARALDFESIDDPPTKKRRVDPPPKLASTSAPPPPQPKKVTLFTANTSGPITRTRDGTFVPVPALRKPPKWDLSPEERAGLGLEPLIVPEISGESQSRDEGSSSRTLDSTLYPDLNTPRNQPDTSTSANGVHKVADHIVELEDYEDDDGDLRLGTDDSPQDTPAELTSTSSWTRPSFLNMSRDEKDLDSRFKGPFLSLFIPPWLLVSLKPCERTPTVTKGVSLTLRVDAITQSDEIGAHDCLDTWTRRFRGTSDIELWDVDDLPRLLPQSVKLKNLFHQLSVIHDAPDRERVILQDLGRSLAANSQFIVLTPSGLRPDDPSVDSTGRCNCRLFLFSPRSDIIPFDFGIQEQTLDDSLVCYYEDVDLSKLSIGDVVGKHIWTSIRVKFLPLLILVQRKGTVPKTKCDLCQFWCDWGACGRPYRLKDKYSCAR